MQWKKYLTTFQIAQFVIDLFVVYFASEFNAFSGLNFTLRVFTPAYSYYAATYFPNLPALGSCAGTESAAVFGCALLSSYLILFIQFYMQTSKKPAGKKPVVNGKANGVANGLVLFPYCLRTCTEISEMILFTVTKPSDCFLY